jgi:hypothetical protein
MTVTAMSLFAPLRELFLLERAERAVESCTPDQRARVLALRSAAAVRLVAARRATSPVASCVLHREAVALLARTRAAVRDARLDYAELALLDGSTEVPDLQPDPNDGTVGDADRVREALAASHPLYLDRLEGYELARLRVALNRAAGVLRGCVEARSRNEIRALRWGRRGTLSVLVLVAAWMGVRWRVAPVNVAVGKPVHASSHHPNTPVGNELVDGRPGFVFALLTASEDSPHVDIDLQDDYALDRIAVYNRSDGWWDDCLPLVVELSRDGATYAEVGRREEYFGFNTPWTIMASGRIARIVRLRVARPSYLALGRVEVFGKKLKP